MNETKKLRIELGFAGGLELVMKGRKGKTCEEVPVSDSERMEVSMKDVIAYVRENLSEKPEMFCKEDGIRPGVLVLINDCDWELEGMLEAKVKEGDRVMFISTLHGG